MGLGRGEKVYKMGLPAFPWEGVDTNTMGWALGGENVYKMGLPSFSWEGVHKYDGHGEVLKNEAIQPLRFGSLFLRCGWLPYNSGSTTKVSITYLGLQGPITPQ